MFTALKGAEKASVGKCCVSSCEERGGKAAFVVVWVGQRGWGVASGAVTGGLVQLRKGPQNFSAHPASTGRDRRALIRLDRQDTGFRESWLCSVGHGALGQGESFLRNFLR